MGLAGLACRVPPRASGAIANSTKWEAPFRPQRLDGFHVSQDTPGSGDCPERRVSILSTNRSLRTTPCESPHRHWSTRALAGGIAIGKLR